MCFLQVQRMAAALCVWYAVRHAHAECAIAHSAGSASRDCIAVCRLVPQTRPRLRWQLRVRRLSQEVLLPPGLLEKLCSRDVLECSQQIAIADLSW